MDAWTPDWWAGAIAKSLAKRIAALRRLSRDNQIGYVRFGSAGAAEATLELFQGWSGWGGVGLALSSPASDLQGGSPLECSGPSVTQGRGHERPGLPEPAVTRAAPDRASVPAVRPTPRVRMERRGDPGVPMEHDSAVASGVDTNIEALSLRPRGGGAPPPRPAASHEPPAAAATKQPGGEVGRIAEGEMSAAQSSAVAAGGEEQRSRGAASRAAGPNPAEDASEPEPALPTVRRMSSPDHLAPGKLGAQVVRHFPFEPDASPVEPAPASPARCGLGGADSCSPHVGTPPPPPAPQDSSPVTPLRARERSTQDVACQAPPQLPLPPNACCMLFVEGFPRDTDIRELRHVFRPLRGFQMLRVVELAEPGGAARPVAYVKFQDVACAAEAMRATQRYIWDLSDMRGPSLRVRYAVAVPSSTATPAGWAPPPSLRLDGVASIPHNAPASIPRSVQAAFPRRVERGAAAAHRTSTIERGEERTPTWWGQTAAADARGMGAKRAGSGDGRKWGLEPAPHETPPRTTALHAGHPRHSPAAQRDESRHGWAGSYATRGGAYEWRAPAAGYDVEGTHGSWEWWSAESMGTERRQAPYDAACADEPRRPAPRSARCAPRGSDSGDLHYVMHPHRERGIDRFESAESMKRRRY